jgi:DNA-binding MarR family transcriptional regulator
MLPHAALIPTRSVQNNILMIEISMSSTSEPPASPPLLDAVRQLYSVIERFDAAVGSALGVDRSALRAINALERGAVSPGELGDTLGLSSGSITALLDRLENAGHIERTISAEDGRRRDARLKPSTRQRASVHYERLGQTIAQTFETQTSDELVHVVQTITRLAECFERASVGQR